MSATDSRSADCGAQQADDVRVVGVCTGPLDDECADLFAGLDIPILIDFDQELASAHKVRVTPSAVLVDDHGIVSIQGIPNNLRHLESLLREEGTPAGDHTWIRAEHRVSEGVLEPR